MNEGLPRENQQACAPERSGGTPWDFGSDPILESLRGAVRARLRGATDEAAWAALLKMNALAFDAPVEAGGMGLGLAASCAVAEELGRAGIGSRYLAAVMTGLHHDDPDWTVPGEGIVEGDVGRARIRQAAYLLGHAHGALACGVGHATRRKQFGQPLREFQGVGFRLANAYASLEAVRLSVARAIWLADGEQPFGQQAAEVLAQAAETASELAHVSVQVCGVRGMTTELAVHRHYLQIRREATRLGRPGDLWRAVGRARLTATTMWVGGPSGARAVGP
jgi:alkylation response protein AidB-like acyl-CoA dehydrogenase